MALSQVIGLLRQEGQACGKGGGLSPCASHREHENTKHFCSARKPLWLQGGNTKNTKNEESPRSSRRCGLLRTLVNSRLAEGEGFEPPEGVNLQRFSRPPQSTALPPLRAEQTAPSPAAILRAGPVALGGASSAGCRATAQGLPVRTARSHIALLDPERKGQAAGEPGGP